MQITKRDKTNNMIVPVGVEAKVVHRLLDLVENLMEGVVAVDRSLQ